MKTRTATKLIVGLILLCLSLAGNLAAQEVLPRPEPPFKGQIGLSAKDSKPDFPQPVQAPKGAPNIVLVLLDDVGFGASSTFGDHVRHRRWNGWRRAGYATHSSTQRRCARLHVRRCSPDTTITRRTPALSWKWPRAFPAMIV